MSTREKRYKTKRPTHNLEICTKKRRWWRWHEMPGNEDNYLLLVLITYCCLLAAAATTAGAPFAFQYWWGSGHLLRKREKEKRGKEKKEKRRKEKRKKKKKRTGKKKNRWKEEKSKKGNIGKGRMVPTWLVGLEPPDPLPKWSPCATVIQTLAQWWSVRWNSRETMVSNSTIPKQNSSSTY